MLLLNDSSFISCPATIAGIYQQALLSGLTVCETEHLECLQCFRRGIMSRLGLFVKRDDVHRTAAITPRMWDSAMLSPASAAVLPVIACILCPLRM